MNTDKQILFSVVIPAYNREKVIKRTLLSVLNQTCQSFEVIIIDDGSSDNTKRVIDEIKDERVKYYYQKNQGAQVARNYGLSFAQGNYVCFLDSDDEWLPRFLEKCLEKFQADSDVGCVYCLSGIIVNNALVAARNDNLEGYIYKEALEQGYITSPTFLCAKREAFAAIGDWDVSFKACQDDDICFRLSQKHKFAIIPEVLGIFHTDGGNQITSSKLRIACGWFQLWNKYEEDVLKYCGKETLAKHWLQVSTFFLNAKEKKKAQECYKKAIKLSPNKRSSITFCQLYIPQFLLKIKHKPHKIKVYLFGFIPVYIKRR